MDRNSEKWSQKCYHSLPFAVKVSVPRSFEQFRSLNWGDKEALRIIQSHHVIKHTVFKQSKGFLTACRNTAAYCIFLPFGTPDSGSKFRRYQVFIRYHWASASMTKGKWLSKRKRNVLRRDDYFLDCKTVCTFIIIPFKYALLTKREVVNMTGYMAKFLFFFFVLILLNFLKVLYFFPAWLCHETSSFARSLRDLTHWSSLRSLTFKNLWEVDL